MGDEVTALFIPGFAGEEHACRAVRAGQGLLQATYQAAEMASGWKSAYWN